MITTLLVLFLAGAEEPRLMGGVVAPAALPSGTNALYGFVGAPELGVGYRQGFGTVELEARGLFNLFHVSAIAEVGARFAVYEHDKLRLAPTASLGIEFNSGTKYFDTANFGFVGLRPRLGLNASYAFTDTVSGIAQFEVPWSIALTVQGFEVAPLLGAGAEFHLGGGFSLLVSAHIGVDAMKEPLGVTQVRPAWAGRLGVGYRIF